MPFRTVALAALVLLIPAFAFAQTPPVTSLKGKFRDVTTNAAVSGVQVKLTSFADTSDVHRVTAGDDGAFEIKGLPPGSYTLEAWHPTLGTRTVTVQIGKGAKATATAKFTFKPGAK